MFKCLKLESCKQLTVTRKCLGSGKCFGYYINYYQCKGFLQVTLLSTTFSLSLRTGCGPRCQRLCLMQHNYYRSLHDSPPLKCDPQLAKSAQNWADTNALHRTVQRSTPSKDYVESISWKKWGWNGMGTKLGAIPGAVRSWYSEIKRGYDYDTGLFLVWG